MPDNPFDPSVLAHAVHDTLDAAQASIPDGKHHAIIVQATYENGKPNATGYYVHRTENGWGTVLEGTWAGDLTHSRAGFAVAKSW